MAVWALLTDIVVMSLLGATIFYAIRLSRNLEHFRQTRDDLHAVINDLSTHVHRAQQAVEELRAHAGQSAINLQTLITRSEEIADELQLMVQAGDALAGRLENLASKASGAEQQRAEQALPDVEDFYQPPPQKMQSQPVPIVPERPYHNGDVMQQAHAGGFGGAFAIRDRDYEAESTGAEAEADWEDDDPILSLSSQAERDLAAVLRRRRGA